MSEQSRKSTHSHDQGSMSSSPSSTMRASAPSTLPQPAPWPAPHACLPHLTRPQDPTSDHTRTINAIRHNRQHDNLADSYTKTSGNSTACSNHQSRVFVFSEACITASSSFVGMQMTGCLLEFRHIEALCTNSCVSQVDPTDSVGDSVTACMGRRIEVGAVKRGGA